MEVKLEKLPKSRVKLTIKVSPIAMGEHFENATRKLSASANVPGFRPGHAPLHMAQSQIGDEKINQEVIESVIPLSYFEAIKKENLMPLHEPKVEVKEFGRGKALTFTAEVDILPSVKIGDYKSVKIPITKSEFKVEDKEIEATLRQLQRQTADVKPVSRAAKKEDYLEIDFESFLDGKPLPNSKSQNHPVIIGQGQFVKEFEDNLIGLKKDQDKGFSVSFKPDFHNKAIAGKKIDFKIKIKAVKEIILPKMDDEWAIKLGKKNFSEIKDSVKKSLETEKAKKEEEKQEAELIEKICAVCETELPESLVLAEIQRLIQNLVYQVESKGIKFDQYLKNIKKEEKELISDFRQPAEKNVKLSLVLNEIKKQEKIDVSNSELEEEIKRLESQKMTIKDEDRERIRHQLAIKKTVDKLKKELVS